MCTVPTWHDSNSNADSNCSKNVIRTAQSADSGPISTLTILTIVLCCSAGEVCAPNLSNVLRDLFLHQQLGMPRQACEVAGSPGVKLLSCGCLSRVL